MIILDVDDISWRQVNLSTFCLIVKITFSEAPSRKSSITSSQRTILKNSFDELVVLVTCQVYTKFNKRISREFFLTVTSNLLHDIFISYFEMVAFNQILSSMKTIINKRQVLKRHHCTIKICWSNSNY